MKAVVERDAAQGALAKVTAVIERNHTIPILANLLIEAGKGEIAFRGTDLDLEVVARIGAQVETPGAATVSAARLADIARNLPAGSEIELTLSEAPSRLAIRSGRSRFQSPTLPVGDFPALRAEGQGHRASMPAKDLAWAMRQTAFAMCREATRYHIGGVNLHVEAGDLVAVATNGHILSRVQVRCPDDWMDAPAITLPAKTVGEVGRLLAGEDGEVEIWTNGRLFRLEAGPAVLTSKLIDADYPDYRRVIPKDNPHKLLGDPVELVAAVKRCSLVGDGKSRPVRLELADDAPRLTARDGEGGEAEETLGGEYDGPALKVGFNGAYLRDIIGQIAGERVAMELGTERDPVRISDPADDRGLFVIMPLLT